jgi:GTP:adenosylcobinamide-phosphate guanylyltransferase
VDGDAQILHCLETTASLADAAALVGERLCPGVLILDEQGKAQGQLSEEDIRLALCTDGRAHHLCRDRMRPLDGSLPVDEAGRPLPIPVPQTTAVTEALLMAGGRGSRLSPLTDDCPKPLLPIEGSPLLHRLIAKVASAGIQRIHISLHFLPEQVRKSVAEIADPGVEIAFVEEEQPLGTAGALGLLPTLRSPILVMNGDILSEINLEALFAWHARHGNEVTVATHLHEVHVPFGLAHFADQALNFLEEKPTLRLPVNAGIYVFQEERLADIPKDQCWDMVEWLNQLSKRGVVGHFPIVEEWNDIGSLEAYQRLAGKPAP